jgi:hypothetical protein
MVTAKRRHPESPFRRHGGESGLSEAQSRDLVMSVNAHEQVPPLRFAPVGMTEGKRRGT